MSKPQPAPKRPADDDSLDEETVRLLKERRDDAGPLRPWSEFEAEEKRRKPEFPMPR